MSLIGVCLLLVFLLQLFKGYWKILDAYCCVDINMNHARTLADLRNHLIEEFRSNMKSDTAQKRLEYLDKLVLSSLSGFNENKLTLKMIFHRQHKTMLNMLDNNLNDMRKDFLLSTQDHRSSECKVQNEGSSQDCFCNDIPMSHMDATFISDSNVSSNQSVTHEVKSTLENKPLASCAQYSRFMEWCEIGNIVSLQQLLTEYNCSSLFNAKSEVMSEGWEQGTPLMVASDKGNVGVVKLLLQHGADMNIKNKEGKTALMMASDKEHIHVIRILLEHGVKINMQRENGRTALMAASSNGHVEVVKLLLQHGADMNIKSKKGGTALMIASSNGHVEVVKLLLQHGADMNIQNKYGWTALMMARSNVHVEVVKLLLQHGADMNVQGKDGWTALMIASDEGHVVVVKLLLQHRADMNIQRKDGKTALMIASNKEIIELLRANGAT